MNFCLSRRDLNPGKFLKSISKPKKRVNWNRLLNDIINVTDMTIRCENHIYHIHKVDLLSDNLAQPCILGNEITIDFWK